MKINIFERYFEDLLIENYLQIAPYVLIVYPLLGFIDFQIAHKDLFLFLFLRTAFLLPLLISYFGIKLGKFKFPILIHIYGQFVFLGIGVCVISYFLGGLQSDYYFGLIIISFLQFTLLPVKARHGLYIDILYFVLFFSINFLPFDYEYDILIKQMTNFISFAIFKFLSSSRSQNLIFGSMHRYSKDKELMDNEEAAQLFGELCHLISNPLFISKALVKKASAITQKSDIESMLNKSLVAQERISEVVKKMLDFNRSKIGIKSYRGHLVNPKDHPEIPTDKKSDK